MDLVCIFVVWLVDAVRAEQEFICDTFPANP